MVSGTGTSSSGGKISFGGLASGIDTTSIINALIAAEQRPVLVAQQKLALQQQKQATFSAIGASLASLVSAASALNDPSIVGARRVTTDQSTSELTKLGISATSAAAIGAFTVDILGLATNTTVSSTGAMGAAVAQGVALASGGFSTAVTTGTFSINGVSITIDASTVLSDGSDLTGANTIIAKIADAGVGVTASVVNDAGGRANLIQLSSAGTIQLGSGADTSNFLAATNLLQSPGTTTRTSTRPLAGTSLTAALDSARLSTALSTASGAFTINGVSISWDGASDTMAKVISRINTSSAGVTATYDTLNDRLVLTSKQTGSATVALADTTGNFLAATGLLAATPSLGANASYKINGGATQYAASNTVTDAVAGVTLSLQGTTTTAVKATVSADNTAISSRMSTFVNAFNSVMTSIESATKYGGGDGAANGALFGNGGLQRMHQQLRAMISQPATGITGDYNTLSSIGLNFGAVGSAAGTTKTLTLDSAKLQTAMMSNPDAVSRLLTSFSANASLNAGGAGSVASISGKPTLVKTPGKYTLASSVSGATTVTFTPDDGSAIVVSTGTLTAGGTNTTMIPGVTITAKPVLVNGTDTITVTAAEQGIGLALSSFLSGLTGPSGAMTTGTDATTKAVTDLNGQIARLNDRIEAKRAQLQAKFNAMEQTISQLKGQQSSLEQLANVINGKK